MYPDVGMHLKIWEMSYTMIAMQIGLCCVDQQQKGETSKLWHLLFPAWDVAIEL